MHTHTHTQAAVPPAVRGKIKTAMDMRHRKEDPDDKRKKTGTRENL